MLHPRHFFFPRHYFLQRCIVTSELTAEEIISAWGSAEENDTFCQALFMDILKVPGIVRNADATNTFFQALFYGNIESAWDSADATNTSFFARHFFIKILKSWTWVLE